MRHFRDIPINRKLTTIIMATCISVLVVAAAAFVINDLISLRHAMVKDLLALAEVIGINSTAALTFQDKKSAEGTLQALSVKPSILFAVIITNDDKVFAEYVKQLTPNQKPFIDPCVAIAGLGSCKSKPSMEVNDFCFCERHVVVVRSIVLDGERIGKIYLAADLEEIYTPLKQNAGIAGLIILASSLLAYLLASMLQRLISKPILQLAQTMKVVSQDKDYSIQAKKLSEDELGILIDGFNEMLVQIRQRDDELEENRNILEEKVAMRTEELANAQAFLTASIKQTTSGIMIAEAPQFKIRLFNQAAAEILNRPQDSHIQISLENFKAMTWNNYHPDGSRFEFEEIPLVQATLQGKTIANEEIRIVRKDETERWILVNASPIRNTEGKILAGITVFSDITERKRTDEAIKASLREKEILLKEIYHRTKNNMQVIISLLNLQSARFSDPQLLQAFRDTGNRIRSMALVHEKLYQSKDLSSINLKDYIKDLAKFLLMNYQTELRRISLHLDLHSVPVNIETAMPCGLIINELISNSLKYAFPGAHQGTISIFLRSTEDRAIELRLADDGVGFPPELDVWKTDSLGLNLIIDLVRRQLRGQIELRREQGTEFHIIFREL
jgi:two-component sensor histidine kinase/PAS domain-containing protein